MTDRIAEAARGLRRIVEEIDGAMNHGTWRDEHGARLKDTPEWVALYNAITQSDSAGHLPPSTSQPGEAPVSSAPAPTGRSTNSPLPTLEWPDDSPPPSWWGKGPNGELTRVYRSYEDYCDD